MLIGRAVDIAREGIIDAAPPKPFKPKFKELPPVKRLRRIEFDFAQTILLTEMLDSLSVAPDLQKKPAHKMELWARTGDLTTPNPAKILELNLPSETDFATEVDLVMGYATLRSERQPEIAVQTQDLLTFFASILPIAPARTRMVQYLLALGLDLATAIVQRMKLGFNAARPNTLSEQIQPMLPTPLHASYPSGHATEAFTVATLLAILSREKSNKPVEVLPDSQLYAMAARIAVNRTVMGVHFPSDSAAGALLGITLGRWIAVRAGVGHQDCRSLKFNVRLWGKSAAGGSRDFYLGRLCKVLEGGDDCLDIGDPVAGPVSGLMKAVWDEAQDEWSERWS